MFVGHFAVGMGAKRYAPALSLGTLLLCAQFLDLLWPSLLVLGLERVRIDPGNTAVTPLDFESYPWSHSLLFVLGWAILIGGAVWVLRRRARPAVVAGILVLSHWDILSYKSKRKHQIQIMLFSGGVTLLDTAWSK